MAEPRRPALVLCAHGTRDPLGRATVREVVDAVAERLPGVEVLEAYVDVHGPEVAEVVAGLPARARAAGWPGVRACRCCSRRATTCTSTSRRPWPTGPTCAPPVRSGPTTCSSTCSSSGSRPQGRCAGWPVVLAPAGSSDARAQADSADMAQRLAERGAGRCSLGYAAGPVPTVADAVRAARAAGRRGAGRGGVVPAGAGVLPAAGRGFGGRRRDRAARAGPADRRRSCWPATGPRSRRSAAPSRQPQPRRAAAPRWHRRRAR